MRVRLGLYRPVAAIAKVGKVRSTSEILPNCQGQLVTRTALWKCKGVGTGNVSAGDIASIECSYGNPKLAASFDTRPALTGVVSAHTMVGVDSNLPDFVGVGKVDRTITGEVTSDPTSCEGSSRYYRHQGNCNEQHSDEFLGFH